jgi:hypothetical protein
MAITILQVGLRAGRTARALEVIDRPGLGDLFGTFPGHNVSWVAASLPVLPYIIIPQFRVCRRICPLDRIALASPKTACGILCSTPFTRKALPFSTSVGFKWQHHPIYVLANQITLAPQFKLFDPLFYCIPSLVSMEKYASALALPR